MNNTRTCKNHRSKVAVLLALLMLLTLAIPEVTMAHNYSVGDVFVTSVSDGYLALRSAQAFDYNNEIGKLYNGDKVEVVSFSSDTYWWVYSYKHNKYGYVNCNYLKFSASGSSSTSGDSYTVKVDSGYLALRSAKAFDYNNELGKLYNGQTVNVITKESGDYWWVYAPTLGKQGYVNKNYLVGGSSSSSSSTSGASYTVKVDSGYLALRSAKAFDYNNELGKLYSGQTVNVITKESGDYWWVYAPTLGKQGYVNKNYLVGGSSSSSSSTSGPSYTVSVTSGYLALRSAKAFDYNNELGKLYSGQTVNVITKESGDYWWVYAPTLGKQGYVNKNYLIGGGSSSSSSSSAGPSYNVHVDSGYLALRNYPSYNSSNEIGKLYNSDTVQYVSAYNSDYWYVYSPKYNTYGYVNRNYLR